MVDCKREFARLKKSGKGKEDKVNRRIYPEFADCPDCNGTLYKSDGTICECMSKYRLHNKLRIANVGERYFDVTLDFYTEYMSESGVVMYNGLKSMPDNTPHDIMDFVNYMEHFVEDFNPVKGGCGFVICGGTGCGKTGATCYAVREVLRQNKGTAYYIDTMNLLETIDIMWNGDSVDSNAARRKLNNLKKVDLLVLDDIGSEYSKNKNWLYTKFMEIIKDRYAHNKQTIMTTNMTPSKMLAGFDEETAGRLSSVLAEFKIIYFGGAVDVRVLKSSRKG